MVPTGTLDPPAIQGSAYMERDLSSTLVDSKSSHTHTHTLTYHVCMLAYIGLMRRGEIGGFVPCTSCGWLYNLSICEYRQIGMSICEYRQIGMSICEYRQIGMSICEYRQIGMSICEYRQIGMSICEYR